MLCDFAPRSSMCLHSYYAQHGTRFETNAEWGGGRRGAKPRIVNNAARTLFARMRTLHKRMRAKNTNLTNQKLLGTTVTL